MSRDGARVADLEPALEQRRRALLVHDHEAHRLAARASSSSLVAALGLVDDLVLRSTAAAARAGAARRARSRRRARPRPRTRTAPCTRYGSGLPAGRNSMSPWPSRFSAPFMSSMVRESTFDRHLERDARREVGLDHAGDHVDRRALRGEHQVDADGARHLRQARDRLLDLGRRGEHEVGQLVDQHDDVRQRLERRRPPGRSAGSGRPQLAR